MRYEKKREQQPIWTYDSPPPTCRPSLSPWPKTTTRKDPTSSASQRVRRPGKQRLSCHKRKQTLIFNPKTKMHCGYMCLFRAPGHSMVAEAVQELRDHVAQRVYMEFIQDGELGGLRVKRAVRHSQQSLNAYLADIRGSQWASQIELAGAAEQLNISVGLSYAPSLQLIGNHSSQVNYIVKLMSNQHILDKLYRPVQLKDMKKRVYRGGMFTRTRAMTTRSSANATPVWHENREYMLVDMHSHDVGMPPHTPHISIGIPDLPTSRPIRAMFLVTTLVTIGRLRVLIATLLSCRPESFYIVPSHDLADHLPEASLASGSLQVIPRGPVMIQMEETLQTEAYVVSCQQSCMMRINHYKTHAAMVIRFAGITGIPVQEVHITDHAGEPWILEDILRTSYIRVEHIVRGGMRRERSRLRDPILSPTVPFLPEDHSLPVQRHAPQGVQDQEAPQDPDQEPHHQPSDQDTD